MKLRSRGIRLTSEGWNVESHAPRAVGLLGALILVSSHAFAQSAATETPPDQAAGEAAKPSPAPKPSITVEEAKRQALELQNRIQVTQETPRKVANPSATEVPRTKEAAPEVAKSDAHEQIAPAGKSPRQAHEVSLQLDQEQRAAVIAQYRQARAALIEARQKAEKDGTPAGAAVAKAAQEQLDAARVQLTTTRAAIERQVRQMSPEAKLVFREKLEELRKKREESRGSRADAHKKELKKELGDQVAHPEVREELATHAWRVARLERVIELATTAGNDDAKARGEQLMKQEKERHAIRMKEVRAKSHANATTAEKKSAPPTPRPADELKTKVAKPKAGQP